MKNIWQSGAVGGVTAAARDGVFCLYDMFYYLFISTFSCSLCGYARSCVKRRLFFYLQRTHVQRQAWHAWRWQRAGQRYAASHLI